MITKFFNKIKNMLLSLKSIREAKESEGDRLRREIADLKAEIKAYDKYFENEINEIKNIKSDIRG